MVARFYYTGLRFLVGLLFLARPAAAQEQALYANLKPLAELLRADGTLNTSTGYKGPIDPRGYQLEPTASGAPRFVPASSEEEGWDARFGMPGVSFNEINALLVHDGDLYAGGYFTHASEMPAAGIARWDGQRWHALGEGIDGTVYALAWFEGNLYAGGQIDKAGDYRVNGIARWDGTSWNPLGDGLTPEYGEAVVHALAVFDGALYVGGSFIEAGGKPAVGLARWNGSAWSSVGNIRSQPYDGTGKVYALAATNGALYVGGSFNEAGKVRAEALAAWNGTAWSALAGGEISDDLNPEVKALALAGDKLYVGGRFTKAGGRNARNVAVWDAAAEAWSGLGQGLKGEYAEGEVNALVLVGDQVYAGGDFNFAGNVEANHVARWDGSAWHALEQGGEPGTSGYVRAIAPGPENGVYIAGHFETAGNLTVYRITRWADNRYHALGQGIHTGSSYPSTVYAVAVSDDGKVYVGGNFSFAGSTPAENAAMWDGQAWHALGTGTDGDVYAIATRGDDVFFGGRFSTAGGVAANHIARWNAATRSWHAMGSGMNGYVWDIAVDDEWVYAVGDYTAAGNVAAEDMARWNGTAWSMLGQGTKFNPNGTVYAVLLDGDYVWIAGDFLSVASGSSYPEVNSMIVWNKATDFWSGVMGGVTRRTSGGNDVWGRVYDLALVEGDLFVAGEFDKVGRHVVANGIARYDGENWHALDSSVGGEHTQIVEALAVYGPDVFAAGQFLSAGGVASRGIARWNAGARAWSGLDGGLGGSDHVRVYDLALHEKSLYAGGVFLTAGAEPASAFARWKLAGDPAPSGPRIRLDFTRLFFARLEPGQSEELSFTISNPGTSAPVTGNVGAPTGPFSLTTGGGPFTLTPGASRTVTVRFAPTGGGTFEGELAVTHDASNIASPAKVSLNGSASAPSPFVTLRHFDPEGQQVHVKLEGDFPTVGSVFGPNKYGDRAKGTLLSLPAGATSGFVTDVRAWFVHKKSGLTDQTYTVHLYEGNAQSGPALQPLYSQSYRLADVNADDNLATLSDATVHSFDRPVRVGPTFFVVFDFGTYGTADLANVALSATNAQGRRIAEVWEQWENNQWANLSDAWTGQGGTPGTGTQGWHMWVEAKVRLDTATPNEPTGEAPTAIALEPNYPNPFNPATTIPFALPQSGPVSLKVYDVLGREVATLIDEIRPAGRHEVMWQAEHLPSGTYLVRLEAGGRALTHRLTLLK